MDNHTPSLKLKENQVVKPEQEKQSPELKLKENQVGMSESEKQYREEKREVRDFRFGRKVAFFIDMIACALLMQLFVFIFKVNPENPGWQYFIVLLGAYLICYAMLPYFSSYTIGGFFIGNIIVDSTTSQKPSLGQLILRSIMFLTVVTGIGYIIYLFKGYYWDKISKTTIIKTAV